MELEELELLEKAATPGPWFTGSWSGRCYMNHAHGKGVCNYEYTMAQEPGLLACASRPNLEIVGYDDWGKILSDKDAAFLAAARNALPGLIAEVKAAREWLKASDHGTMVEAHERLRDYRKAMEANGG